ARSGRERPLHDHHPARPAGCGIGADCGLWRGNRTAAADPLARVGSRPMGKRQRPHPAPAARRMEPLEFADLPEAALLLVDSPPIIYILEDHPEFGPRFAPLFAAHAAGQLRFAVTTITVAEVLVGPLRAGDDALAQR